MLLEIVVGLRTFTYVHVRLGTFAYTAVINK